MWELASFPLGMKQKKELGEKEKPRNFVLVICMKFLPFILKYFFDRLINIFNPKERMKVRRKIPLFFSWNSFVIVRKVKRHYSSRKERSRNIFYYSRPYSKQPWESWLRVKVSFLANKKKISWSLLYSEQGSVISATLGGAVIPNLFCTRSGNVNVYNAPMGNSDTRGASIYMESP